MAKTLGEGRAAGSVIAKSVGLEVLVTDVGMDYPADAPPLPGVIADKLSRGYRALFSMRARTRALPLSPPPPQIPPPPQPSRP